MLIFGLVSIKTLPGVVGICSGIKLEGWVKVGDPFFKAFEGIRTLLHLFIQLEEKTKTKGEANMVKEDLASSLSSGAMPLNVDKS